MTNRKLSRRSFLARVAGGVFVTGGAIATVTQRARADQVSDHDPTDPIGQGRGGGSGITDSDTGPSADPAGRGRGGSGTPQSGGNGGTGITDSDSGPNADPWGHGRGTAQQGSSYEDRQASCDRLRQLEAQYRADMGRNGLDARSLAEMRNVQNAIIEHCS
ncbi:MAG TPA: hypothetical protein VLK25_11525 [Allosphingosinicella sp.]|nr:hypothetical protein [Allosphingosinicella sp.]